MSLNFHYFLLAQVVQPNPDPDDMDEDDDQYVAADTYANYKPVKCMCSNQMN